MKRSPAMVLVAASLAGYVMSSDAATTTTTMNVTLTLGQAQAVTVTAGPLTFTSGSTGPFTGTGTITVNATSGLAYSIGLDGGLYPVSGATGRALASNAQNHITYYLYQDAAGSIPWGTGFGDPNGGAKSGSGNGTPQLHTVYGTTQQFTPGTFPNGTYTDVVTVTVTF